MKNKKALITIGIIAAVVIILIIAVAGTYNSFIKKQETIETAKSDISTQLQRRADLIPNFAATVKSYKDYESSTLTAVTEARSAVAKATNNTELADASQKLDSAISVWVNAITEAYPNLKADTQYIALQDELAGTENRITQARKKYNDTVKTFNTEVRTFPKNIIAGIFGFEKYDYFEASAGSENVPNVSDILG